MYSIEMSEAGNRPPVPQHLSGLPRQGMAGRLHHELCDPGPKRDPPEAILDTLPGSVRVGLSGCVHRGTVGVKWSGDYSDSFDFFYTLDF